MPTTIPPQFRGGNALSWTSASSRNAAGSTCEQSVERQTPPARSSRSPIRSPTGTSIPQAALPRGVSTSTRLEMSPL